MSLLSAIFSGQKGFLDATQRIAVRSDRIANLSAKPEAYENLAKDLVENKMDGLTAKANLKTFSISSELFQALSKIGK